MIKRLLWVALGAAGALQADRWFQQQRARFRPSALTGTLLDATNKKLEQRRTTGSSRPRG